MPLSQQDEFGDFVDFILWLESDESQCRSRSKMNSEFTFLQDKGIPNSLNAALAAR